MAQEFFIPFCAFCAAERYGHKDEKILHTSLDRRDRVRCRSGLRACRSAGSARGVDKWVGDVV